MTETSPIVGAVRPGYQFEGPAPRRQKAGSDRGQESVVEQVVKSGAFKDFMRTAAREVARGMFRSGRR